VKLRRSIQPLRGVIDMTALIDVVLLLLIFFMLSSSFVMQPGIQVEPPRGFHSGVRDSRHIVTILAQEPPLIFFNDRKVARKRLESELQVLARRGEDVNLIIRADRAVSHGTVVEIMNTAIQAGLSVVIATKPDEP